MQAIRHVPCPVLAPYVKSCWEIRHELPPDKTIAVPFGCTGRCHFVFCLESPFQCYREDGSPMDICESTLFVQNTLPYTKHFCGPTLGLVIDFTPIGIHTLWQLPVQDLSEQSVDLAAVLTGEIRNLPEQLREARSAADRFALVEQFLLRRLAYVQRMKRRPTGGRIEAAVDYIQHHPGHFLSPQLAHYVNCSERTLRRRFTEVVGISPKLYARIQRFMYTRHWVEQHPGLGWQDILLSMGYYDQAHLINEFRYFTGKSPLVYGKDPVGLHNIFFE